MAAVIVIHAAWLTSYGWLAALSPSSSLLGLGVAFGDGCDPIRSARHLWTLASDSVMYRP